MDGLVCDACGATLLLDSDVRYVLKAEGFAAYDPMEIANTDLERDLEAELRETIDALSRLTAEEAQDQVHRLFQFDLCPECWRRFLKDPLSGARPQRPAGADPSDPGHERKKSQGD